MQTPVSELSAGHRSLFVIVAILSLAGAIVSGVSLQRHYAKSATTYCDFNQQFNCDIVNRSEWSTVAGIPVAAIGVAGYALLFLLATLWRSRPETPIRLLIAALIGFAFALYLTYVEKYQLMTWCILCLTSQALIFLISVTALLIKVRTKNAEA
jgi:vitamin-K-epoxide reductase (warfarin-sensitive)